MMQEPTLNPEQSLTPLETSLLAQIGNNANIQFTDGARDSFGTLSQVSRESDGKLHLILDIGAGMTEMVPYNDRVQRIQFFPREEPATAPAAPSSGGGESSDSGLDGSGPKRPPNSGPGDLPPSSEQRPDSDPGPHEYGSAVGVPHPHETERKPESNTMYTRTDPNAEWGMVRDVFGGATLPEMEKTGRKPKS